MLNFIQNMRGEDWPADIGRNHDKYLDRPLSIRMRATAPQGEKGTALRGVTVFLDTSPGLRRLSVREQRHASVQSLRRPRCQSNAGPHDESCHRGNARTLVRRRGAVSGLTCSIRAERPVIQSPAR